MTLHEILSYYAGKKILVTGGTGLIGRQVIALLCESGAYVKSVSLDQINAHPDVEHEMGDLTNFDYCKKITTNIDCVFHLAGVQGTVATSISQIASHFVPTLMMNTNMLEASRINEIEKLVFTSSIGAYAEAEVLIEKNAVMESTPMSFGGWAKRIAEQQIYAYKNQYGIKSYTPVRLGAVYGPGDNFDPATAMVIPAIIGRIYRGENPIKIWGDGNAIRDFLYSTDAAEGIIRAFHFGTNGEIVNIASGYGTSVRNILEALQQTVSFNYEFDLTKPLGALKRIMDISNARTMLQFEPKILLADGLKKTWEWFCVNSQEYEKKINYFRGE